MTLSFLVSKNNLTTYLFQFTFQCNLVNQQFTFKSKQKQRKNTGGHLPNKYAHTVKGWWVHVWIPQMKLHIIFSRLGMHWFIATTSDGKIYYTLFLVLLITLWISGFDYNEVCLIMVTHWKDSKYQPSSKGCGVSSSLIRVLTGEACTYHMAQCITNGWMSALFHLVVTSLVNMFVHLLRAQKRTVNTGVRYLG